VSTIITTIETDGPGGAEQVMMRLATAHARRGIETVVCLIREGWLAEQCRAAGFEVVINPLSARVDLGHVTRLRALVRARGAAGVHSHEFTCNFHASLAATLAGVPCVTTVHGKGYYAERYQRRAAVRATARMSQLTAVSSDIRDHLIARCGVPPQRVTVVENGIAVDRYGATDGPAHAFRTRLGIAPAAPLLGALGSYYPVKGHEYLIEAMPRVLSRFPDATLLLAGQGELADALGSHAARLGLGDRVRVIGYLDDPREYLAALDVFVMPSLSEGMPLALLEAAATRLPLIATRVGGMPELVTHEHSGLLVPPADAGALADAVIRLLAEPALAGRYAALAQDRVRERWSIESTALSYAALLGLATPA